MLEEISSYGSYSEELSESCPSEVDGREKKNEELFYVNLDIFSSFQKEALMTNLHLKARDACIDNVVQYIGDAKQLIELKSHGHAYALAVVGMEELAKAFAYNAAGTNKILPKSLVQRYIEMHTRNTRDTQTGEVVKAHITKLQQYRFISKMHELNKMIKAGTPPFEAAQRVFDDFAVALKAFEERNQRKLHKELNKLLAEEERINKSKMDALYVEVAGDSIKTPLDSRFRELARQALNELEETTNFAVHTLFRMQFKEFSNRERRQRLED